MDVIDGTLNLINSAVINNTDVGQAGGIYFQNSSNSHIINSTLSGNSVPGGGAKLGGGILNLTTQTGLLTLTNVTMVNNTANI